MTLPEIEARLSAAGVDSPRFDALELIAHFEHISRNHLPIFWSSGTLWDIPFICRRIV